MNQRSDIAQRRGLQRATRLLESLNTAFGREFARVTGAVLRDFQSDETYQSGLLNRDGGPLEFSCSTLADDVRYTLALGGAMPPQERLGHAHALLLELGVRCGTAGVRERFERLQTQGRLRWGAWLGVRHTARGTRFKIYAEVPPQASVAASELLARYSAPIPSIAGKPAHLVMVGQTPGSARCEFYFELPERTLAMADLERLLACAGLPERRKALTELVGGFEFRRGRCGLQGMPEAQWGFSLSLLPDGGAPVFSLIVFAQDLMGGDGLLRWQFLQMVRHRGWNPGCYEALSAPLEGRAFQAGYHNMITFSVGQAELAGIQMSLSPPPQEIGV